MRIKAGLILILLAAAVAAAGPAAAATELSVRECEEIVSTYSIDPGIPSYREYAAAHDAEAAPAAEIVLEGADAVRYLDEENAGGPGLLADYEGNAGVSLLTGEEAVAEWEFTAAESGWYDPDRQSRA